MTITASATQPGLLGNISIREKPFTSCTAPNHPLELLIVIDLPSAITINGSAPPSQKQPLVHPYLSVPTPLEGTHEPKLQNKQSDCRCTLQKHGLLPRHASVAKPDTNRGGNVNKLTPSRSACRGETYTNANYEHAAYSYGETREPTERAI